MKRFLTGSVCTAALALTLSLPAFAGEWKNSEYGWWYDRGDGTCAPTGWHWIDGNNDGIAECYYFNEYCYCVPWSVVNVLARDDCNASITREHQIADILELLKGKNGGTNQIRTMSIKCKQPTYYVV